MPDGWRDQLTEVDEHLSGEYVSRWRAKPQVIASDRSDAWHVHVDHVSEDDRPKPLTLGTSVSYDESCPSALVTIVRRHRADRTDRLRIVERDADGRVMAVRHMEPMERGTRVRRRKAVDGEAAKIHVAPDVTLTVALGASRWNARTAVTVTRPRREVLTFIGLGPAHAQAKEPTSRTRPARAASARKRRAAVRVDRDQVRAELTSVLTSMQTGQTVEFRGWVLRREPSPAQRPRFAARPAWDVLGLSGHGLDAATPTAVISRLTGDRTPRPTEVRSESLTAAVIDDL
jgi:hypothetical protein